MRKEKPPTERPKKLRLDSETLRMLESGIVRGGVVIESGAATCPGKVGSAETSAAPSTRQAGCP